MPHPSDTCLIGMTQNTVEKTAITLLGVGAMGFALARTWLVVGHPVTVWNRTQARAAALAAYACWTTPRSRRC